MYVLGYFFAFFFTVFFFTVFFTPQPFLPHAIEYPFKKQKMHRGFWPQSLHRNHFYYRQTGLSFFSFCFARRRRLFSGRTLRQRPGKGAVAAGKWGLFLTR
jgi:hypothetical protein